MPVTWFDVTTRVGFMKEHPSVPEHWITMIRLLVDGKDVSRIENKSGGISAPTVTFKMRLDKPSTLEAVEDCNLHGTWISEPVRIKIV